MVTKKAKELRFTICGLGSMGSRCLNNLELLGIPCGNISVVRTRKGTAHFGDEVLKKHNDQHVVFPTLAAALEQKPDAVLITNPTSLHRPSALEAVKNHCHIFITKPLSHNLDGVDELIRTAKKNNVVAFVSYQLRFHPLLRELKRWLGAGKIGKILSVHAELSERVTDWHPWENYAVSYASRKSLGGGPILSFSHEIDYLYWLFGKPEWVFAAGGKLSDLKIDVEDTVKSIIQFPQGIIASLHLDFLKRPPQRFLEITGEKGRIYWDYFGKTLTHLPLHGKKTLIEEPAGYERNQMHLDELKHFLSCIAGQKQPLIDLSQGKEVLKIALAIKQSMKKRRLIYL